MPVIARPLGLLPAILLFFGTAACDAGRGDQPEEGPGVPRCGPGVGVVAEVIDGDTIVLESGEKVRYLMVNTPEITNGKNECYGHEASDYNAEIVLGQEIELTYDEQCTDPYGRLLAYVEAPDGEINTLLVARGYGCVLQIPPNGEDRYKEFTAMESNAKAERVGLWRECDRPCDP